MVSDQRKGFELFMAIEKNPLVEMDSGMITQTYFDPTEFVSVPTGNGKNDSNSTMLRVSDVLVENELGKPGARSTLSLLLLANGNPEIDISNRSVSPEHFDKLVVCTSDNVCADREALAQKIKIMTDRNRLIDEFIYIQRYLELGLTICDTSIMSKQSFSRPV